MFRLCNTCLRTCVGVCVYLLITSILSRGATRSSRRFHHPTLNRLRWQLKEEGICAYIQISPLYAHRPGTRFTKWGRNTRLIFSRGPPPRVFNSILYGCYSCRVGGDIREVFESTRPWFVEVNTFLYIPSPPTKIPSFSNPFPTYPLLHFFSLPPKLEIFNHGPANTVLNVFDCIVMRATKWILW